MLSKFGRFVRVSGLARMPRRYFSEEVSSAMKQLSAILKEEIKGELEHKDHQESASEAEKIFQQAGWKLTEEPHSTRMILEKKIDGTTVTLAFEAKAQEQKPEETEENEEEEAQEDSGVEFSIFLGRDKQKKVVMDCYSSNGQLEIANLSVLDSKNVDDLLKDRTIFFSRSLYAGPSFESLDERVQEKVHAYLAAVGVEERILSELERKAYAKEQKLYTNWLKNFDELLQ